MKPWRIGVSILLLVFATQVPLNFGMLASAPNAAPEKGPDFALVDVKDQMISPGQYLGKKLVLLFYFGHG